MLVTLNWSTNWFIQSWHLCFWICQALLPMTLSLTLCLNLLWPQTKPRQQTKAPTEKYHQSQTTQKSWNNNIKQTMNTSKQGPQSSTKNIQAKVNVFFKRISIQKTKQNYSALLRCSSQLVTLASGKQPYEILQSWYNIYIYTHTCMYMTQRQGSRRALRVVGLCYAKDMHSIRSSKKV